MRGMEPSEGGEFPVVKDLQAALFPVCPKGCLAGNYLADLLQTSLKTTQLEISTDWRTHRAVAKLREPRDLYALKKEPCAQQNARWPVECQVVEDSIEHLSFAPPAPEHYYNPTGRELQPRPVGEEAGTVVFDYNPTSAVSYYSRSVVGGTRVDPELPRESKEDRTLQFESRFESGNLAKAVKVTDTYYELYLRTDLYTNRHMQWFYFQVRNTRANTMYRFSIVNLSKPESLYSCGMKPLLYSCKDAQLKCAGWHRTGDNITYFRNDLQADEEDANYPTYTLTFTLEFPHDHDTVYLSHCYPYTYSTLQDYLLALQNHPVKSTFTKLRLLCRTVAGNNVYYLTVTEPSTDENKKKKPAVVVTARVHPGETPSSYMMKGLIDFLTGNSEPAKELRHKFIFKLVPMLNPDGVIVGNNRCSLTGRDLNRQYRTVIRETYPPVWHTKVLLRRLSEDCGIALYCDLHAHSRRHNVFIYGCESRRSVDRPLQEQVFPLMMRKNAPDKFCFESCKFRIQRSKEGTGRVVVWMMGVPNSYTMEASFGGSTLGSRTDTHFSVADYEGMGRSFCETLLDYCDDEPSKEKLRTKIMDRLLKEGSSADEPTNINLSDYSSDEGDTSSCSEEEDPEVGVQVEPPRKAWSVCEEDITNSPSASRQGSPEKLSPKSLRANPPTERNAAALRQSLHIPCATLDLPEVDGASEDVQVGTTSSVTTAASLPSAHSHRRHRSREWAKIRVTTTSPSAREGKSSEKSGRTHIMPPELIVTQAQVYEACLEVTEKLHVCKEVCKEVVTESISLPNIEKRPPSSRPHTSDTGRDRQRSASWQQMRSIPVYRAYYESHRVLVQRQAVEDRMAACSPPQGRLWGSYNTTSPTRSGGNRAKLQRQKSRQLPKPKREEEVKKEEEPPVAAALGAESRPKKGKLRARFKKSSLVTVAVSRANRAAEEPAEGSPVKSSKPSVAPKHSNSTPKRRSKKLAARVQSTDF